MPSHAHGDDCRRLIVFFLFSANFLKACYYSLCIVAFKEADAGDRLIIHVGILKKLKRGKVAIGGMTFLK